MPQEPLSGDGQAAAPAASCEGIEGHTGTARGAAAGAPAPGCRSALRAAETPPQRLRAPSAPGAEARVLCEQATREISPFRREEFERTVTNL